MNQNKSDEEDRTDLRLLNVEQVVEMLGIGHSNFYKLIRTNKIKSVKIGSRRFFTNRAVREYIASLEEKYETQS